MYCIALERKFTLKKIFTTLLKKYTIEGKKHSIITFKNVNVIGSVSVCLRV